MDPWVSTQIRLAERQGLLTGPQLGSVQLKAVFLCEMLDLVKDSKREDTDLRAALLATGRYEFADLFPERSGKTKNDEEESEESSEEEIEQALESDDRVIYRFSDSGTEYEDPEQVARLFSELIEGSTSGQISSAELDGDWS